MGHLRASVRRLPNGVLTANKSLFLNDDFGQLNINVSNLRKNRYINCLVLGKDRTAALE